MIYFVLGYESNHEKKISGYSPDLTPGNTEIASVCYEYSYSDSNSNHSKVGKFIRLDKIRLDLLILWSTCIKRIII